MDPDGWTDRQTDGHTRLIARFTTGIRQVVNNKVSQVGMIHSYLVLVISHPRSHRQM